MKHILRFLLIYSLVAAAIVFVAAYILIKPLELPYGGSSTYRIAGALLIFFDALPAILCGAFIGGASRSFGLKEKSYRVRFSPSIVADFRETIFCAIICVALVFAADEAGAPLLKRAQKNTLTRSEHIVEYLEQAQKYFANGDYLLAQRYVNEVLRISPKNEEAQTLSTNVEYANAELRAIRATGLLPVPRQYVPPTSLPGEESYSVFELLQKSRSAFQKKSWFDAHFYANTALSITTERDPNYADAKRLSSEAWNYLMSPEAFSDEEASVFYAKKREGYRALINGDNLHAYSIFEQLNQNNSTDPDVTHYLQIATTRARNRYFFINEIPELDAFRNIHDLYFAYAQPDGGKNIVFIKGIAPLKDSGKTVLFLRELSVSSYNAQGAFEMAYTASYAKMFEQPATDLDEQTQRILGVTKRQKIPYIMLEGVDSQSGSIVMEPRFMFTEKIPSYELNFTLLGIPYDDLLLLIDSTHSLEVEPLWELFKFSPLAEKYGFSKETYLHALYSRLAWPFIFVILMLISGFAAWCFRMSSSAYFKLLWVPIPLVVMIIAYAIIESLQHISSVFLYTVVGVAGQGTLAIVIVGFIVLFFVCTIFFVTRKETH